MTYFILPLSQSLISAVAYQSNCIFLWVSGKNCGEKPAHLQ